MKHIANINLKAIIFFVNECVTDYFTKLTPANFLCSKIGTRPVVITGGILMNAGFYVFECIHISTAQHEFPMGTINISSIMLFGVRLFGLTGCYYLQHVHV